MPEQPDGALDAADVTGLLLPSFLLALNSGVPIAFWAFGFSLK